MALFTKFKKAKEAAAEHKKAQETKPAKTPYRHVPTHAIQDAIALSPTIVRSEDIQARIAAARQRRATSYDSSMTARRAVYHSCPSSRTHSRANSATTSSATSTTSSMKGKARSSDCIENLMRQQEAAMALGQFQNDRLYSPLVEGPIISPPILIQRPRPHQTPSRRSSFTKKKSPLSKVSMEQDSEMEDDSSNRSRSSTASSITKEVVLEEQVQVLSSPPIEHKRHSVKKPIATTAAVPSKINNDNRRSRWSFFSKKGVSVAAH